MLNTYNPQIYGVPLTSHTQFYKIIPISSKADTSKFVADFNGTPLYFHNQTNNEIYIKQFDMKTGVTTIQDYKRAEQQFDENKQDIQISYENDIKQISDRIDCLQKTFDDYINSNNSDDSDVKKGSKK